MIRVENPFFFLNSKNQRNAIEKIKKIMINNKNSIKLKF